MSAGGVDLQGMSVVATDSRPGLHPDAIRVYRAVLADPGSDDDAIGLALGFSRDRVRELCRQLIEVHLLARRETSAGCYVAINPEIASRAAFADEEAMILRRYYEISRLQAEISALLTDYVEANRRGIAHAVGEVASGERAVQAELRRLAQLAHGHIMCCCSEPSTVVMVTEALRELLLPHRASPVAGETLCVRVLLPVGGRHRSSSLQLLSLLCVMGGEARVSAEAPPWFVLGDRSIALLPARPNGRVTDGVMLVGHHVVLDWLRQLFEQQWQLAAPYEDDKPGAEDLVCPDELDIAVLKMLAAGMTDQAAARSLGMSVRQLRRRIAAVRDRLGASSRFQVGVLAAARSWI
jgi:DNA-binding CsgD family transcriptional regulator